MTNHLNRRRFLAISGACLIAQPAMAQTHRWSGIALGAEAEVTIHGPKDIAAPALSQIQNLLQLAEAQFSLFDPDSALSNLNRSGTLTNPAPVFQQLLSAVDPIHNATNGLFDPTVQPLWQALAEGKDPAEAEALIGWRDVKHGTNQITLRHGQALTLNGIAQGFATDLVTAALR
ncbi:MAG: FAD:protein FMN transferase, partial [Pikeienuella sp.]